MKIEGGRGGGERIENGERKRREGGREERERAGGCRDGGLSQRRAKDAASCAESERCVAVGGTGRRERRDKRKKKERKRGREERSCTRVQRSSADKDDVT